MTNSLNIQSLINNSVLNKSDNLQEFYSLLDKENKVNYNRTSYLVNFICQERSTGVTSENIRSYIEELNFSDFIAEASLHPSITVDINQYSLDKIKAAIDMFIGFAEKGDLFTTIDVSEEPSEIDIYTMELELTVERGKPTFKCSICNPCFGGYENETQEGSISFIDFQGVQIVDYLEIELF